MIHVTTNSSSNIGIIIIDYSYSSICMNERMDEWLDRRMEGMKVDCEAGFVQSFLNMTQTRFGFLYLRNIHSFE